MPAQFTTKSLPTTWYEDGETIVITRDIKNAGFPVTYSPQQIYSGAADFQTSAGNLIFNPSGAVDSAIGEIVIDPDATGALPSVQVGDVVEVNGLSFSVVQATTWTMPPKHLELVVRRGPIDYQTKSS